MMACGTVMGGSPAATVNDRASLTTQRSPPATSDLSQFVKDGALPVVATWCPGAPLTRRRARW
jgi:hypothetical protein